MNPEREITVRIRATQTMTYDQDVRMTISDFERLRDSLDGHGPLDPDDAAAEAMEEVDRLLGGVDADTPQIEEFETDDPAYDEEIATLADDL